VPKGVCAICKRVKQKKKERMEGGRGWILTVKLLFSTELSKEQRPY